MHAVVPPPASVPPVMAAGMQAVFKGQVADLRAQNADLIAERGAAATRHKAEVAAIRNEYDRYKADNTNTGRRNEIANTALAAAKTASRAAESALAQERLRVQQLERELAAARVQIGGLQGGGGRPGGQVGGRGGSQYEMRPGDWTCPTCRSHNFASKLVCFRNCGTARPARPAVNVVAEGAAAAPPGLGVEDRARYARFLAAEAAHAALTSTSASQYLIPSPGRLRISAVTNPAVTGLVSSAVTGHSLVPKSALAAAVPKRRAAAAVAADICAQGGSYWRFGFLRRRNSGQGRGGGRGGEHGGGADGHGRRGGSGAGGGGG